MASVRDLRVPAFAVGIALSAAAFYLGTGLHPVWWLTWLAPIPVLLIVHRVGPLAAFAASFGVWFLGSLNMWAYMRDDVEMPAAVVAILMAAPAAIFALAALLARALVVREQVVAGALAVPVVWVAVELVVSLVSPHGTFGSLAYYQMDFLPVVQVASIAGALGVSFLVLFVPSTGAVLRSGRGTSRARGSIGAACAILVLVGLGFGYWRLATVPRDVDTVIVGLASADMSGRMLSASDAAGRELLGAYTASLDAFGARGVRVAAAMMPSPATMRRPTMVQVGPMLARIPVYQRAMTMPPRSRANPRMNVALRMAWSESKPRSVVGRPCGPPSAGISMALGGAPPSRCRLPSPFPLA
jgi:apolipoprotein N-acyltransferase